MSYTIDENDLKTTYGVRVEKSRGLLDMPKRKKDFSHNWKDEDGEEAFLNTADIYFEPRTITLYCYAVGTSKANLETLLTAFKTILISEGLHTLGNPYTTEDLEVFFVDAFTLQTPYPASNGGYIARFVLKLREPRPAIPSAIALPVFDPDGGEVEYGSDTITITCATGSTSIYYTLDRSDPITSGTLYSTPIAVPEDDFACKAAAKKTIDGKVTWSHIKSAEYTVTSP